MYTCSLCSSAYVALQICSWLHGCCTSTETNCWVSFCNHSKVYYHYACRLTLIEQCQMERNRSKVHYCYTCRPASIQHNVKCNSQLIMSASRKQLASNLYKTYDLELTVRRRHTKNTASATTQRRHLSCIIGRGIATHGNTFTTLQIYFTNAINHYSNVVRLHPPFLGLVFATTPSTIQSEFWYCYDARSLKQI